MTILDKIADRTLERIESAKQKTPLYEIREKAEAMDSETGFPFEKALRKDDISFICEVKKASPSKGIISEDFDYLKTAKDYESADADAISVLTEPHYFMGADKYLREISEKVSIPTLRKDFTVDSYMIYEAKTLCASAILLICAIIDEKSLREYLKIASSLGLSAIVEAHDEDEVKTALKAGARIIGVNNRNLKDFSVDINTSVKLRKLVPDDVVFVAESGIKTPDDIERLREVGANAVLIGESLMRASDVGTAIRYLRESEK